MSKLLTITLDTAGDAFAAGREGVEVARILRKLADTCADGVGTFRLGLRDQNGNTCGHVDIETDEEEYDDSMDGDHASALASAGFGTDEDYGYYGGGDD